MAATLTQSDIVEGSHIGATTKLFKKVVVYNAGNPTAALSDTSIGTDISGFLSAVRVIPGGTAFDSLLVTIKDSNGNTLVADTLTGAGELDLEGKTPLFVNGLTIACSGNSTNSATATITITYFN